MDSLATLLSISPKFPDTKHNERIKVYIIYCNPYPDSWQLQWHCRHIRFTHWQNQDGQHSPSLVTWTQPCEEGGGGRSSHSTWTFPILPSLHANTKHGVLVFQVLPCSWLCPSESIHPTELQLVFNIRYMNTIRIKLLHLITQDDNVCIVYTDSMVFYVLSNGHFHSTRYFNIIRITSTKIGISTFFLSKRV